MRMFGVIGSMVFGVMFAGIAGAAEIEEPAPPVSEAASAAAVPALEVTFPVQEPVAEVEAPVEIAAPVVAAKPAGPLSAGDVRNAVSAYVERDMKLKGGFFLIYDAKYKRVWKLYEPRIGDTIRLLDKSTGVACVIATSGKSSTSRVLDVDLFVSRSDEGEPVVSEIRVHKSDNRERYYFDDDNKIHLGRRK